MDAGTTVNYVCVGFGRDEPTTILWRFGNEHLANDTLVAIYETQLVEDNHVFTRSILELCSVKIKDTGVYSCTAVNSRGSNSSSFILNVRPSSKKDLNLMGVMYIISSTSIIHMHAQKLDMHTPNIKGCYGKREGCTHVTIKIILSNTAVVIPIYQSEDQNPHPQPYSAWPVNEF